MDTEIKMKDKTFELDMPDEWVAPIIFSSPHSGRTYPQDFLDQSKLDSHQIRLSEDLYVDLLLENISNMGLPLIKAIFPRAFIDLNRAPFELDQGMFREKLPGFVNTTSPRLKAGLGTIARNINENLEIYKDRLSVKEGLDRIETFYKPYHEHLQLLIQDARKRFGMAILIDCHSMPSRSRPGKNKRLADIVLGDAYGQSCAPSLIQRVEQSLKERGVSTSCNQPYSGGYITRLYGKPRKNIHVVQIEINRKLYVNEETLELNEGFNDVKLALEHLTQNLIHDWQQRSDYTHLAAE